MRLLASIFFLLAIICNAHSEPKHWCIDQLGGGKYQKEIVSNHPDNFIIGIFTQKELFADAYPVINALFAKRNVPGAKYNLRWSDTHSFSRKDFPVIVKEAKRFVPLVNKYPNKACYFSGATEHQLNRNDAQELANQVLAVIPQQCKYINNPWTGKGAFIPTTDRIINEVHGSSAQRPNVGGPYSFSFDGSDAFDSNVTAIKQRLNDAEIFCFWTSQNNGRANSNDSTPRAKRKFWPTGNLIKALGYLATDEGPVSLPKNYLLKPKSDQHTVPPQPRELRPVFIVPPKVKKLNLRRGNQVFKGQGPQAFADGRVRFYFPQFGFQMGSNLNVMADGKKVGTVNAGFRAGSFREK